MEGKTALHSPKDPTKALTLRALIEDSVSAWPDSMRLGLDPTVDTWLSLTRRKESWTDIAFVQTCADKFKVCFALTGVNDLGDVSPMFVVCPLDDSPASAWLEVGCWLNRHFVAIVDLDERDSDTSLSLDDISGPMGDRADDIIEWSSFSWPLTSVSEVKRLLDCTHIRPTALVGMEFSGAVRLALEERGIRALSVDFRPSEAEGMHFVGDVREVVHLQLWERMYLFPPCFQQFRGDECLTFKIADGRAFWGIAMVLWCACLNSAASLMVEQSDTIVVDFIPLHLFPDVEVLEAHTSDFGDDLSKPLRLTHRNLRLLPPPKRPAPPYELHRSHLNHISPEVRDRTRSSWTRFPKTSAAVAAAPPKHLAGYRPPPLDYIAVISLFARAWAAAGHPVPKDFRNPDARPSSQSDRDYQLVRGAGDGRVVDAVTDESELLAPPVPITEAGQTSSSAMCEQPILAGRTIHPAVDLTLQEDDKTPRIEEIFPNQPFGPCGDAPRHSTTAQRLRPLRFARTLVRAAFLVVLCLASRPLVLAHREGCVLYGIIPASPLTNSAISTLLRREVSKQFGAGHPTFLVGEYTEGARLFVLATSMQEARLGEPSTFPTSPDGDFEWLGLPSVRGTAVEDPTFRAYLAVSSMIRPISEWIQTHDSSFRSGRSAPREVISLYRETSGAPPVWKALHRSLAADRVLIDLLAEAAYDPLMDGWMDTIRPLPLDSLPSSLIASLPTYDDERLNHYPLPSVWQPYQTLRLPAQPAQPPPRGIPPDCPRPFDLYLPAGRGRLISWLQAQREDLLHVRRQLDDLVHPDDIDRRHRPEPMAIGQSEMLSWAQGLVWDCRRSCCVPLDYTATTSSNLSLTFLAKELSLYPDQQLFSHLIEGVSLEADVELQTVLVPHLTSLPKGFASVVKELRRLQKASWYEFFWEPPFVPFYLNGQGAVARKLEPDRYRRSTEGGGPRKPTYDASGLRAVSINFAARYRHLPHHFIHDNRPSFVDWLAKRGLTDALDRAKQGLSSDPNIDTLSGGARYTKWPKEVKPTVAEIMQALAVLKRAGAMLGQDVYVFGDDLKDYFNQLRMQTSDLWKLNIAFLEEPGDPVFGLPPNDGIDLQRLIFVSEKRLGFGTHPASNVAQRFSYAILDMFRARMDEGESHYDEGSRAWLSMRQHMREDCHNTSRYRSPPTSGVHICPQHRLYAAFIYTDDPVFLVVGSARAIRAISVWRRLVKDIQLITAIPEKRSLGSWTSWLGVVIVASLGVVFVPKNKLVRALAAVLRLLQGGCEFHEYRSLCGLLEHLRAVLLKGRGVMHGLYEPHSLNGANAEGPTQWVTCTPLMRKQFQRWRSLITQAGGVSVKDALLRRRLEARAALTVTFDSDACHGDAGVPSGIGGYSHGLYWYFQVPVSDYTWVNTPGLEFLGVCFSVFMADYLFGDDEGADVTILLRTDALTSALTLPSESQKSPFLITAYQHLVSTPQWARVSRLLKIQHIFGDANVMADAVSRAYWPQFASYCAALQITPRRLDLHPAALSLFDHCRLQLRPNHALIFGGALPDASRPSFLRLRQPSEMPSSPQPAPSASSPPVIRTSPAMSKLRGEGTSVTASPHFATAATTTSTAPPTQPKRSTQAHTMTIALPSTSRQLPPKLQSSALTRASITFAHHTSSTFVGDGPMDFHMPAQQIQQLAAQWAAGAVTGINDNTHTIDARAWSMWETVCGWHQTTPYRTAAELRDHPERNYHLLTALTLYAFVSCKPRNSSASHIKPNSAFSYPLAIIRIFGRWGVHIAAKALKATLHQLSRYYLQLHGQYSLVPRRAEPMKYSMVLRINRIAPSAIIDRLAWSDTSHDVFMFKRLNLVMWPTGCRLAEFTGGFELMHFTFESLTWSIGGVIVTNPTQPQLRALRPGVDFARLTPPRSKPDQFGETHCPFPIVLLYELCEGNAASALRDLELRCAVPVSKRPTLALFHTSTGAPYTHSRLDRLFKAVLKHCFGPAVASAYSWHSYRSGLATALHAAGVDDARIQLICRWLCPASLLVYRRMGSAEYSTLTSAAMRTHVDSLQSQNIMRLANSTEYADILSSPLKPISYSIAEDHHRLVKTASLLPITKAHIKSAPVVSNDALYSELFSATQELDVDVGLEEEPPAQPSHAPARTPSRTRARAPTTPNPQRPPLQRKPPAARRRVPAPTGASSDRESTTGVGALRFRFPSDLSKRRTYNQRRSKRRPPTKRYGPSRPTRQG